MSRSQFDDLLDRYVAGQVTETERLRIESWLDLMKRKDVRDLELSPEEEDELYQRIISSEGAVQSFRPESLRKKLRSRWTLRIAAGLFILVCSTVLVVKFPRTGTRDLLRLNDGTIVWLQEQSKFAYWEQGNMRFARLEGEGLFEVARDAERPFVIKVGDARIRVVGTSFNVRTGEKLEVKVLTGTVQVTSATDSIGVTLTRNMQVVYDPAGGFITETVSPQDVARLTRHPGYNMKFTDERFESVLQKLEKKFDVVVETASPSVRQCRVNIDLTDNSLTESMEKITAILNVEYAINGRTVVLTGDGCR